VFEVTLSNHEFKMVKDIGVVHLGTIGKGNTPIIYGIDSSKTELVAVVVERFYDPIEVLRFLSKHKVHYKCSIEVPKKVKVYNKVYYTIKVGRKEATILMSTYFKKSKEKTKVLKLEPFQPRPLAKSILKAKPLAIQLPYGLKRYVSKSVGFDDRVVFGYENGTAFIRVYPQVNGVDANIVFRWSNGDGVKGEGKVVVQFTDILRTILYNVPEVWFIAVNNMPLTLIGEADSWSTIVYWRAPIVEDY